MATLITAATNRAPLGGSATENVRDADQGDRNSLVPEETGFEPAPDGGLQAWFTVAGAGAVSFACFGFSNSYGTFQEYYLAHQLSDRSTDDVAWIGSTLLFLQLAAACISGPLFDRFGTIIIWPSAIGYVVAIMVLSLCQSYWQFMLVQGVVMGILGGLLEIPTLTAITHWFDKKRATVLGLAISGSSLGGVVMPIVTSTLLNNTSLGYAWTLRIIGFFNLPILIFACFAIKTRIPPRKVNVWEPQIFKNPKFMILICGSFLLFMGQYTPVFFIPTYATLRGTDATLAGYLLAILNAVSTFGRIIPGILADRYGRINILAIGGIISGVIIYFINFIRTDAVLIGYSVVFGFWSGTIMSGTTAVLPICTDDLQKMGTYLGMALFIISFGTLIGPPLNGILIERYSFNEAAMFSGSITVFGGLLTTLAKLYMPTGFFGKS